MKTLYFKTDLQPTYDREAVLDVSNTPVSGHGTIGFSSQRSAMRLRKNPEYKKHLRYNSPCTQTVNSS